MENKTTSLNNKLKSYSALAGTLIAAGSSVDAQVVYTDVLPDATVLTGTTYDLDLDNNAVVDFQFAVTHQTYLYNGTLPVQYDYAVIVPAVPANAIDTAAGGPAVHNVNDPIGSSLMWVDGAGSSYQLLGLAFAPPFNAYNTGNFLGATDKYIGLRFMIGTATHYGWVRIDLNSTSTILTIKDHGYDATANTTVLAGATATGINNELASTVNIFSENSNIHVNMNNAAVEGTILVTDVLGKEVVNTAITSNSNVISMDNAKAGIYFVTVSQGDARFTQKVIIK
jgi:hypothetical protein